MDAEGEIVELARRMLAEGQGLDAVLTALERAELSTLAQLAALRSVTGLGLQEVARLREAFENDRPLAHVTENVLRLLRSIPHLGGEYGHWIGRHFLDAVLGQNPWLTLVPGSRDPARGSIRYWTQEAPGGLEDSSYGSLSGPGIDFDAFRAEMSVLVSSDPFLRRHAVVVRDTPEAATYRFTFNE